MEQAKNSFAHIQKQANTILEIQHETNLLRADLEEFVLQEFERLDTAQQSMLATFLYWNYPTLITVELLATALHLSSASLVARTIVDPLHYQMTCVRCGIQTIELVLTSRDRFIKLQRFLRSGANTYGWDFKDLWCDDCKQEMKVLKAKQDEESHRQFLEFRSQKAAYLHWLKTMPYHEYLETDHWKEVRRKALKRAAFRCQVCNTNTKPLNVHHRTYVHRGEEENSDVIVLCSDCHHLFHESSTLKE